MFKKCICIILVVVLLCAFCVPTHAVAIIDDLAVTGIIAALGAFGVSMSSIGNNGAGIASTVRGWIDSSGADATGATATVVGGGILQVNGIAMRTAKAIYDWITGLFADDETDYTFVGTFDGSIPPDGTYDLDSTYRAEPAIFLASLPGGGAVIDHIQSKFGSVNDLGYVLVEYRDASRYRVVYANNEPDDFSALSPITPVYCTLGKLYLPAGNRLTTVTVGTNTGEIITSGASYNFTSSGKAIVTGMPTATNQVFCNFGVGAPASTVVADTTIDASSIPLNDGYIVTPFSFTSDSEAIADFNEAIALGDAYTGEYTDVYEPDIPVPDYTDTLDGIRVSVDSINVGVGEGVGFLEGILDGVVALTADIGGFITSLPAYLASFAGRFAGIWHYVVSWVGSLGAFFGRLYTVWSGLPYAMVVPVYATAVIVLVVGMWRRFFG